MYSKAQIALMPDVKKAVEICKAAKRYQLSGAERKFVFTVYDKFFGTREIDNMCSLCGIRIFKDLKNIIKDYETSED